MADKTIPVTDDKFEHMILNSAKPVLVDFWAPWCGPCKMVAPLLEAAAEAYEGRLVVAKVNTDENSRYAMEYGVQGIPTMLIFYNGAVINQHVGAVTEPDLKEIIEATLELSEGMLVM